MEVAEIIREVRKLPDDQLLALAVQVDEEMIAQIVSAQREEREKEIIN